MAASFVHTVRRTVTRAARSVARAFWRRPRVSEGLVFLESFDGNGALCNSEAIFRARVTDPDFSRLRFVWSLRSGHDMDLVLRDFRNDRRVSFVAPGTVG